MQNIAPSDEKVLEMFMSKSAPKRVTLADIILAKIKEKETEMASQIDVDGKRIFLSFGLHVH